MAKNNIIIGVGMTTDDFEAGSKKVINGLDKIGEVGEKGGKKAKSGLKEADSGMQNMQKTLKGLATTMGVTFGATVVVDFAKKAISAASDLNETMSKSEVVFGDANDSIVEMGNNAAQSLGMTKEAAIGAAATYGNLFVSMGLTKDKSAEMSTTLVQLATDLGSFNNIPVDQVFDKLRAGLTGESEPLKSLGINMNDVTLKQEAITLGLYDGKGALDAGAKAQAAYTIMLKQSTTAQGDFARTSDGAANQQKILNARLEDTQATIGTKLLPAWVKVLETTNDVITAGLQWIELTGGMKSVIADHEKDVLHTAKSYGEYTNEMIRSAKEAKIMVDEQGNIRNGWGMVIDKLEMATEAEYNQAQAIDILTLAAQHSNVKEYTTYWDTYTTTAGNAAGATSELSGSVDGMNAQMSTAAGIMEKYTTQLLFNKAAAGLTDEAAFDLAYSMGLVDESTVFATNKLETLKQRLADGEITLEEYILLVKRLKDEMNGIQDRSATISITTVNTAVTRNQQRFGGEAYASGGSFTIPNSYGYEGYPLGPGKTASGGETVTVTPAGGNPPANGATYNIYAANDPNAIIAALQHRQAVERAMA